MDISEIQSGPLRSAKHQVIICQIVKEHLGTVMWVRIKQHRRAEGLFELVQFTVEPIGPEWDERWYALARS